MALAIKKILLDYWSISTFAINNKAHLAVSIGISKNLQYFSGDSTEVCEVRDAVEALEERMRRDSLERGAVAQCSSGLPVSAGDGDILVKYTKLKNIILRIGT